MDHSDQNTVPNSTVTTKCMFGLLFQRTSQLMDVIFMFLLAVIFSGCYGIMRKIYFVEYVSFNLLSNIALVALTNCFVAMPMLTARHK